MSSRFPTALSTKPFPNVPPLHSPQGYPQHRGRKAGPAGDRPVHTDTHRYPIGSHHSSVWCSSPHDLRLSCASLHIFPTSQPRSLVISTLWISHLHALLMLVPPPRKSPSPLLVTFSPSLLSKPYLSIWFRVTPSPPLCSPPIHRFPKPCVLPKPQLPHRWEGVDRIMLTFQTSSRRHFMLSSWNAFKIGSLSIKPRVLKFQYE